MKSYKSNEHFYGIDILRIIFLWTIVNFHTYETFFYQNNNILPSDNSIFSNLEGIIRTLTFSGFGLVTLSSFLLGWIGMNGKNFKKLFFIFSIGLLTLAWLQGTENQLFYFEWDIYNFLFISFLLISILNLRPNILYFISFISFILLLFPIWNIDYYLNFSSSLKNILLGNCSIPGQGAWPLIPWMGIVFIPFSIAQIIQKTPKYKKTFHDVLTKKELVVWLSIIILLSPWLGEYALTPGGPDFGCYVYRRPPIVFFSHWAIVLFLIRLSFVFKINNYLKEFKLIIYISSLHWNRHLGLTYGLHFVFLNLGYLWKDMYLTTPFLIDFFIVCMLISVELSSRLIFYFLKPDFLQKKAF